MKSLLKPHFFLWNQLTPCIMESAKGFSLATIHSWISSAMRPYFLNGSRQWPHVLGGSLF